MNFQRPMLKLKRLMIKNTRNLNVYIWGILIPIGVLMAANKNNLPACLKYKVPGVPIIDHGDEVQLWFHIHRFCNMTAVLFHFIAFFIAIDMTKADHFFILCMLKLVLTITIFCLLTASLRFCPIPSSWWYSNALRLENKP
eukprot:UN08878